VPRDVRSPATRRERVFTGAAAVLALTFTISSLTAASSAGPDRDSATAPSAVTPTGSPQLSPLAGGTELSVGAAAPPPTDESSSPAAPSTAAPAPAAPETVTATGPPPATVSADLASPPPAPDVTTLITGRLMHTTDSVNIRDAAGVDGSTVLDTLPGNQQVITGDPVDGWVPVQWGAIDGWVSASYLADGPAAGPVAPAPPAPSAGSSGNWMMDLIPQVDPNGYADWVFQRNGGWGASDGHTVYIDPNVPADKRFSVMVHEYSHVLQARVFGGLANSKAALSAIIGQGPSDVTANESTADCMALLQGATWINYGCRDELRAAAAAILAGHRP
jgi:hypothetical protein